MLHKVKATREGLISHKTASGFIIDKFVPFVALPDYKAIFKAVRVTNPLNSKSIIALVLDTGPWNTSDDNYVFGSARPQSETGTDLTGRLTNGSGIDLGEHVWNYLGMKDNTDVEWEFIE